MLLTLTAAPAVIDDARSSAEHCGMTLGAFVLTYMKTKEEWKTCQAH